MFKFGDILTNGWASDDNPEKVGIFIREKKREFVMTDGKGDFWEQARDKHKLEKIGSCLAGNMQTEIYAELMELRKDLKAIWCVMERPQERLTIKIISAQVKELAAKYAPEDGG